MVSYAGNPSAWEAEVGELLQVCSQPRLHNETLFQKKKKSVHSRCLLNKCKITQVNFIILSSFCGLVFKTGFLSVAILAILKLTL